MNKLGFVVIGRNEGKRLKDCLTSIQIFKAPIVYVDSSSTDNSVQIAESFDCDILKLDESFPLSAGRARNEGFYHLITHYPETEFVQFVDGDCVVDKDWINTAIKKLKSENRIAAVLGHQTEKNPDKNIYKKLFSIEWYSPPGELSDFGNFIGNHMIKAEVFIDVNGFNPNVIAGEDSELAVRLYIKGYRIYKINCHMTTHDADINSFKEWWKRSVRAGHAIAQRAHLNGDTKYRDCVKAKRSTILWGGIVPYSSILLSIPTKGISLLFFSIYILIGYRSYRYRILLGDNKRDSILYSVNIIQAKFANFLGLIKFYINKLNNRFNVIEYQKDRIKIL